MKQAFGGNTRVIGNWQPRVLPAQNLEEEFRSFLTTVFGNIPPLDQGLSSIRSPVYHDARPHRDSFHCDGVPTSPSYLILWSNVLPTEVRFNNDFSRLKTRDGDVLFLNNSEVEHRCPAPIKGAGRWFIRISYYT